VNIRKAIGDLFSPGYLCFGLLVVLLFSWIDSNWTWEFALESLGWYYLGRAMYLLFREIYTWGRKS
jgi:hypothetical protein